MSGEHVNDPIASTRVWHGGKAFDVSTIDRNSSAAAAYGMVYAETLVFEVLPDGKRGSILAQGEAARGSIGVHQDMVAQLRVFGKCDDR